MKYFYTTLIAIVVSALGFGQTTIYSEDFESDGDLGVRYTSSNTFNDGTNDHFGRTNGSDISGTYNSPNNSFYWAGEDLDDNGGDGSPTKTITFNSFNISGFTDLTFRGLFASGNGGSGWDAADELYIEYSIDGGSFQKLIQFASPVSGSNVGLNHDPNLDGTGEGTALTTTFTEYSALVGATGSTLQLRLFARANSASEEFAFDNFIIEGTATSINDADTEVFDPTTQVTGATIIAANATTSGTAFDAFGFEIEDQGTADGVSTDVTTMRFVPGSSNTADWTDHIQGITLIDGDLNTYTPTVTIADTEILLDFTTAISIADGASLEFLLGIFLNTTNIVDGSIVQLQIDAASSGFVADAAGSDFIDPFTLGDIIGNNFTIDVDADELRYIQQPSDVQVSSVMTPNVQIAYTDVNGNIDTDYDGAGFDISLTTTGSFDGTATTTVAAVSGTATFNNLIFDTDGSGLILTATDDSSLVSGTYDSSTFDVTLASNCAVTIDFTTQGDGYTTSETEFLNSNEDYFTQTDGTNINAVLSGIDGSFFAAQDIDSGASLPAELNISNIDISGLSNLEFSIDLAEGDDGSNEDWDAPDYLRIYYTIDANSEENLLWIENDGSTFNSAPFTDTDFNGTGDDLDSVEITNTFQTFTVNIPSTGSIMNIRIEFNLDSGDEDIALDNIQVCGIPSSVPATYTFNTGVWTPSDPNGVSTSTESILIEAGDAVISTNTDINTVVVNPGASLTVDAGATLTVADTSEGLTLESTSTSYSSLIRNGTISGTVHYERYVNQISSGGPGNDLVSVPLTEFDLNFQSFLDFGTPDNRDILATNPGNTVHAFGPYNNTSLSFENFPTYLPALPPDPAAEPLISGKGYRAATTAGANITFTGNALSTDVAIDITTPTATVNSQWNLLGNPYPSFLDTSKFLTANNTPMEDAAEAIYAYNAGTYTGGAATTGNFTIINNATITMFTGENFNIAPGQGFFVPADITPGFTGTVNFVTGPTATEDMRTTSGADDYIVGRSNEQAYAFKLGLNSNTETSTTFFFMNNATRDLDPGYDAATFGGSNLFSHLVDNNTGLPMALQALSILDMSDVVIPLGVNANQGQELTFNTLFTTLPDSIEVYLEDSELNTVTLLNASDYILTPNTNLSGTGRFYLRFSNVTLSSSENNLDTINIYTNQKDKTIIIEGLLSEDTDIVLYDLQGRLVNQSKLNTSKQSHSINVSHLSTGVYVIQLNNTSQKKTKKIILR